jgi:hypothetical protein
MDAQADVPSTRYQWQQSYLAAALETDAQLLPSKITEARRDIRRRLSDCAQVDESEQSAIASAINALTTLERERLKCAADSKQHSTVFIDLPDAGSEARSVR